MNLWKIACMQSQNEKATHLQVCKHVLKNKKQMILKQHYLNNK